MLIWSAEPRFDSGTMRNRTNQFFFQVNRSEFEEILHLLVEIFHLGSRENLRIFKISLARTRFCTFLVRDQ